MFSRSTRVDAAVADTAAVERVFRVTQTGKNPLHYTVELPHPVMEEIAGIFNRLFGRR